MINSNLFELAYGMLKRPKFDKTPTYGGNQGRGCPKSGRFHRRNFLLGPKNRSFPFVSCATHKLSLFITLALIHPIFCHILSPNLPPNIAGVQSNRRSKEIRACSLPVEIDKNSLCLDGNEGKSLTAGTSSSPSHSFLVTNQRVGESSYCGDPIPLVFAHH